MAIQILTNPSKTKQATAKTTATTLPTKVAVLPVVRKLLPFIEDAEKRKTVHEGYRVIGKPIFLNAATGRAFVDWGKDIPLPSHLQVAFSLLWRLLIVGVVIAVARYFEPQWFRLANPILISQKICVLGHCVDGLMIH